MKLLFVVATAVVFSLCASLIFFQSTRKTYPGFGLWTTGLVVLGLGLLFFCLRGYLPDFVAIPAGNVALPLWAMLQLAGMRKFLARVPMPRLWYVFLGGVIVAAAVAYGGYNSLPLFSLTVAVGISAPHFAMALLLVNRPLRHESVFYGVIGSLLALGGIMILVRSAWAFSVPQFHAFLDSPVHFTLLVGLIVIVFVENIAFIMLNGERIEKELLTSEELLKEREQFLAAIIDNVPDMIFVKDAKEHRIISINRAGEDLIGYSRTETIGKSDYDVFSKEEADFFTETDREVLETGAMKDIPEETIHTKHKGVRIVHTKKIPLYDKHGAPQYVLGISEDVTDRTKAEAALRERQAYLRAILNNAPFLMWLKDREGRFLAVNDVFAESCGRKSPEDVVGKTDLEIWPLELAERYRSDDNAVMDQQGQKHVEELLFDHGQIKWFETFKTAMLDEKGHVMGTTGFARDITDKKEAEEKLRWNEALLRTMATSSPLAYLVVDNRTDEILYFNHKFCEIWGIEHLEDRMKRGELKNRDIIHDCLPMISNVEAFAESFTPLQREEDRSVVGDEIEFTDCRTIRRFSTQLRDETDRYYGRFYIFEDITQRRETLKALKESEELWHSALEGAGHGVWDWNPMTNEVFFSKLWKSMLGYESHEISGSLEEWSSRVHPLDMEQCGKDLEKHFRGETDLYVNEHRIMCKDGTYKWILDRGKIIRRNDQKKPIRVIGTHTDITERKETDERLRKSEEKHRRVFENIQDVYLETLHDGTIVEVSPSVKTVLGYSREELVGTSVLKIYNVPEERLSLTARLDEYGIVRDHELSLKSKDGKPMLCSSNARLIRVEYTNDWHICGVMRDISRRKQTELTLKTTFQRFYTILSSLNVGVLLVGEEGRVEFANQAFCDMFYLNVAPDSLYGLTSVEMIQKTRDVYARPEEAVDRIREIVADQVPVKTEEIAIRGGLTYLRDFVPLLIDGHRYGRLWYHHDITERKRAEDKIKASLKEKEVSSQGNPPQGKKQFPNDCRSPDASSRSHR